MSPPSSRSGATESCRANGILSAPEIGDTLQQRNTYYSGVRQFMEGYNLLLTPTLPVTAFTAGLDEPDGWQLNLRAASTGTPFTFPQPDRTTGSNGAVRGRSEGLPVGLQIVGRWRDDSNGLARRGRF